MPHHTTTSQFPANARVLDRDRVFTVPGTVIESNDMVTSVEWDDGAGLVEVMFNERLEPFCPAGSAR